MLFLLNVITQKFWEMPNEAIPMDRYEGIIHKTVTVKYDSWDDLEKALLDQGFKRQNGSFCKETIVAEDGDDPDRPVWSFLTNVHVEEILPRLEIPTEWDWPWSEE